MTGPVEPAASSPPFAELTAQVVRSFDAAASTRYREVMQSLVRHLHAFIGEVGLTEGEWWQAVDFLTRTGQRCDASRQEFVLLSDVLGASMATVAVNHPDGDGVTESTVLGPFFVEGAPFAEPGADIAAGAPGQPCHVSGAVRDTAGAPVAGARIEVWEADAEGHYDVQLPGGRLSNRAHLFTGADGGYHFWSVRPAPYPIPYDGPVGELLTAAGRGPMRPAHIHFMVSAPGLRTVTTHVFAEGDAYLHDDAVFGVRPSLVRSFVECPPGEGPGGRLLETGWTRVTFDIVLAPAR